MLYKLSLSNCESFSSCFECISSYDPLCGWCLLEGKCIRRNSCQSDSIVNICPLYNLSTIPSNISVDDSQTKIFLPLGDFSQFEENEFICKYDEEISSGQWSDTGIICATPKNQLKIPSDSLIVDINVFYSTYNTVRIVYHQNGVVDGVQKIKDVFRIRILAPM
ncbi:unnamed protein product [Dracunculus medinensis]|uniref:PSI domain-containing protein n=1 Tax=Dracunculus medinensis TaxID=318479 RepID=A0A0N4U3M8_DRAME|nr:unnamed protein product [Dracunculus medinensis]